MITRIVFAIQLLVALICFSSSAWLGVAIWIHGPASFPEPVASVLHGAMGVLMALLTGAFAGFVAGRKGWWVGWVIGWGLILAVIIEEASALAVLGLLPGLEWLVELLRLVPAEQGAPVRIDAKTGFTLAWGATLLGGQALMGIRPEGRSAAQIAILLTVISVGAILPTDFFGIAGGPAGLLPLLGLGLLFVRLGDPDTPEDAYLLTGTLFSIAAIMGAIMLGRQAAMPGAIDPLILRSIHHAALGCFAVFVALAALVGWVPPRLPNWIIWAHATTLACGFVVLHVALIERQTGGDLAWLIGPAATGLSLVTLLGIATVILRRALRGHP